MGTAHNGNTASLQNPIATVNINLAFKDNGGNNICTTDSTLTFDVPVKYMGGGVNDNIVDMSGGCPVAAEFFTSGASSSDHNDLSYIAFTKALSCASTDHDDRDNFPDCYQGDEIHFELSYTAADANTNRIDPWRTVAKLS